MIRAVLDTNVVVAGLLKPTGPPGEILSLLRGGAFIAVFSRELVDELAAVLAAPKLKTKYRQGRQDLEAIAGLFALRGELVEIGERVRVCRDPDDDFLIETALAGRADFLVSGDKALLVLSKAHGISIVNPAAVIEILKDPRY
jgi:putative PIN family toxin of toxin-antitoxin system